MASRQASIVEAVNDAAVAQRRKLRPVVAALAETASAEPYDGHENAPTFNMAQVVPAHTHIHSSDDEAGPMLDTGASFWVIG